MKTIGFVQFEPSKAADVAQASDRFWSSPPSGIKLLGRYVLMGPLPVYVPGQTCVVVMLEAESEQALLSAVYNISLAGATMNVIPAMEFPTAPEAAKVEEGLRR